MKIDKNYLEFLIRDSEKLRIIESLLESDIFVTDALVRAVIGIAPRELEKPVIDEPDSLPFVDEPEKEPMEEPMEKIEPKNPKPEKPKIDRGKVMALHKAGWTNAKIAEEIGCATSTISMIVNKVGVYAND